MEENKTITEVKIMDPKDPSKIKSNESEENSIKVDEDLDEISTENVDLVYKKPPRFFRTSLIHKTKKLFVNSKLNDDDEDEDENRSLKANISWFIIMGIGSLLAFSVLDKAWQRFQGNPMITNLIINSNEKQFAYPTVTICPENAADMERIDQFLINYGLYNKSSKELNEFFAAIPNFSYDPEDLKYVILLPESRRKVKEMIDLDIRSLAFEFALSCSNVFKPRSCSFRGKAFDCCEIFLPIYTEKGFCYTFNSRTYNSFHGKTFREKLNLDIFRFMDNDYSFILSFALKPKSNIYTHSYEESLHARHQMMIPPLNPGKILSVISMQETISDFTVRELRLKQRKCLFENEAKFKYYKNDPYSYSTCMKECRIDRALKICGCLPPVYLTEFMENITKCNFEDLKCLKDQSIVDDRECNCLLPCEFTSVSIESINRKSYKKEEKSEFTTFSIALKNFPLVSYLREVKFGFVDFLVAFGSILALFLSFSFLSLIELILYLVRMFASKLSKNEQN